MKVCALVIGHKKTSSGASNKKSGLTEFAFNDALAQAIEENMQDVIIQRIYRRTLNSLPNDINQLNPDFIVSLHCNAFNKKASGSEVLYYHRSSKGKIMAKIINKQIVNALSLRNRGIKAKTSEDRGGYLLKNTQAPCVIVEPFFIDNNRDLKMAQNNQADLINAYVNSIKMIATTL